MAILKAAVTLIAVFGFGFTLGKIHERKIWNDVLQEIREVDEDAE